MRYPVEFGRGFTKVFPLSVRGVVRTVNPKSFNGILVLFRKSLPEINFINMYKSHGLMLSQDRKNAAVNVQGIQHVFKGILRPG